MVISSVSVYGILLAGWSSNSKYALLGSVRSVSQLISYEVFITLINLQIILLAGTLDILHIVLMQIMTVWFC
jgi:NADH-quinone oxidoreductase subunit H